MPDLAPAIERARSTPVLVVPDVAIVTHNTDYYLLNLLNSLAPLHAAGLIGDVHVWDNASSDRTAALVAAYTAIAPWVRANRSTTNLHHGPALDRLLRESCRREWVLILDADTEVRRSFEAALGRDDLGEAAFAGQVHPQMPHLYAYLAHVLVHRSRYLALPRFRHHGAPGIDYFRAVEIERRPYVRFRWCDYVHHFGQGALGRIVERDDRNHEFYAFARAEDARRPKSDERRARERAMEAQLEAFLARHSGAINGQGSVAVSPAPATPSARWRTLRTGKASEEGAARGVRSRSSRDRLSWLRSPRRARALNAARRLGLTQLPAEASRLMRIVERLRPRRVLEIGTAHGGSFLLWARAAAADAMLISVGLPPWELDDPGEIDKRQAIERVASRRQTVHVLRGDSHRAEVQARVRACLRGEPVDFLFIDADHSCDAVRRDFHDYAPLVRPGGLVAFHDIHPHSRGWGGDVPRVWREIRERHRHVELIADRRQDGFGIGAIWI